MNKPRILILTAAGKTGLPLTLQLLDEGFSVTAFVRREDARSEHLKTKGAAIMVGSITDPSDMRRAMTGAQRAYFCTPLEAGALRAAAVFASVAAEQRLESVVVMSQWLASPHHPSLHTRETWLADRLFALLPETMVTTLNPGFFADNDLAGLTFAAQFGLLMLPYGSGKNAPPSNEDLARVAAEILARPQGHAGRTYRPTGPALLSPQDLAAVLGRVLGHSVRYVNAPIGVFTKVLRGLGLSEFATAQYTQYARDYQRGAFAVNAPTDVVRRLTGREPEDFETIARRYVASSPHAARRLGTQLGRMAQLMAWILRPAPTTAPYLALEDFSEAGRVSLSADSAEWQRGHARSAGPALAGD
ncbi:NmrA family transcriptional regulator [Deinococcus sp. Arct2-2]|uniref:NmrA family NAD(P)-binding protein n=1 Tax=Deinococcus sp. Arct2-2 TaxID=2568653 RepID=UPI0010A47ED5|nr:NAD(P)H-binding protein [Deinococcus sp. Arct2-2]THF67897.1 NmrA family transcriptional regulator [Deinococcus sp. Arct2-2]